MFGIVIAFENYVPYSGVLGSQWVGLKWFKYFFKFPAWTTYLSNTLILSLMNIVLYFPAPIILALLLNEMRSLRYKKAAADPAVCAALHLHRHRGVHHLRDVRPQRHRLQAD